MDRIVILDDALVNKIAAGEVIERPASIVKELIENSIDAGASSIVVEVREGGKSYIRVNDDGLGMSRRDAELCWKRHATSKLKGLENLFSISTLGFRGEALGSIASVSHMRIITREEGSISGSEIIVKGGVLFSSDSIGCEKGTSIEVKNLFYNTPARRKYLKSISTELGFILDIITRYALIQPSISFRLTHGERELLNYPQGESWPTRVARVYGHSIMKELISINYSEPGISVEGFVSKPSLSRKNRQEQSLYINKRYIKKNNTLTSAIDTVYSTLLMKHRYPVIILSFIIPEDNVDVNVHPQKAEIRLREEKSVFDFLIRAIKDALKGTDLIPEVSAPMQNLIGSFPDKKSQVKKSYEIIPKQLLLTREDSSISLSPMPDMNILGIINRTYILAEIPGSLLLIDQHAAAERILFEKYLEQLKAKRVEIQQLLNPALLELTAKQYSVALSGKSLLEEMGFRIEEFGRNTLKIISVPNIFGRQFDKNMFMDFLSYLEESGQVKPEELMKEVLARMACRTAIKAGDLITLPQIKSYVHQLSQADSPYTCPHGRPVFVKLPFYEIEKMFKRVV